MAEEIDWTESYRKHPVYSWAMDSAFYERSGADAPLLNRRIRRESLQEPLADFVPIPEQTEDAAMEEAATTKRLSEKARLRPPLKPPD